MSIFAFGDNVPGYDFKVLNEREVRGIAGVLFLLGIIAFIQGFILNNFAVIPYISGFMLLHFLISVLINPKFSPVSLLVRFIIRKQTPIYIGAVQKRFAWSLGIGLSLAIFITSLFLNITQDLSYFQPVCLMCIICLILMYLESVFAICVGCKLYFLSIKWKLIPAPVVRPNCMGDSCDIN